MNERTTYLTWTLCFLAGGLAGASAALLLAPQSGRATRDGMGRKLHETADSARSLKNRVVSRGEAIGAEAMRRVDNAASALSGNSGGKLAAKGPASATP